MAQKHVFTEGLFTARNASSLGLAAVVEILIALGITAGILYVKFHPEPPPPPTVTPVMEIPPNPPPPPPPPPQNQIQPQIQEPQPLSEVPPIPIPVPTPDAVPPPPPSPPPVPTSKPVDTNAIQSEFQASMLAAINAQKQYPKDAVMAGDTGTATVSFDYVNGQVTNVKVDKSSGSRSLDKEAIRDVQRAQFPPKPAELVNITHFVFLINFSLS